MLNVLPKSLAKSRTISEEKSSDLVRFRIGRRFLVMLFDDSNSSEKAKCLLEFAGLLMQPESSFIPTSDEPPSRNLHGPLWPTPQVIAQSNLIRKLENAANAVHESKNFFARSPAPNRRW